MELEYTILYKGEIVFIAVTDQGWGTIKHNVSYIKHELKEAHNKDIKDNDIVVLIKEVSMQFTKTKD